MELTRLKCPACGAQVRRTDSPGLFHCDFCGGDFALPTAEILQPSSAPVKPQVDYARAAASELAVARLNGEIKELEAGLAKAVLSQDQMKAYAGVGIFAFVVGVIVFIATADMEGVAGLWFAIFLMTISGAATYLSVLAHRGWQVKTRKMQEQVNQKNAELKKHQAVIDYYRLG